MTWAASADARTGTISNPIRSFQAFVHTAKSDASSVRDRKSTRLNSSHSQISYAVFCLKKKTHDIIDSKLSVIVHYWCPFSRRTKLVRLLSWRLSKRTYPFPAPIIVRNVVSDFVSHANA